MQASNRVVARFRDGAVVKGTTSDFFPNRAVFHVMPSDGSKGLEVRVEDLKALFFVQNLEGDPTRNDARGFISGPKEHPRGRKIAVVFRDGELVCGYSLGYTPQRDAFFLFPADAQSNNQRIFVVVKGAAEVREGTAAEEFVQKLLESEAA